MKYCEKCGSQVRDEFFVCQNCGYVFENKASAPQQMNVPPAQPYNNMQSAPQYTQQPYNTNMPPMQSPYGGAVPPARQLKTDRGLLKTILLTIFTLGIYSLVLYYKMSSELNLVASRYDGKKTMNYALLIFLITPLTLGIGAIVWFHKFSDRIGNELSRRQIDYTFSASTFWLWNVLGTFIIVGPFVYLYKLLHAMNFINADYNVKG